MRLKEHKRTVYECSGVSYGCSVRSGAGCASFGGVKEGAVCASSCACLCVGALCAREVAACNEKALGAREAVCVFFAPGARVC